MTDHLSRYDGWDYDAERDTTGWQEDAEAQKRARLGQSETTDQASELRGHRDHFRGRCALALDWNAKITHALANAIRVSPMRGCTDLGTIATCREYLTAMLRQLDDAEESARAVQAAEEAANA